MTIRNEAELRALYGDVSPRAKKKVIDRLDGHCRAFIAASPFVLIATTDGSLPAA
jgi:predicted pyridoxine 5'-phosphate oxidase superfamily flavin-nucleotide-binding protein